MRHIFIFFLLFGGHSAHSQDFFTSFFGGLSSYYGDLQEKKLAIKSNNASFGMGLLLELNDRMLVRADFAMGKISGDDKASAKNKSRNLNFFTNISEFSLGFEYVVINLYDYKVSPYFFTGITRFNFNPKTTDSKGNIITLFEMSTEGQGFYEDRKLYKLRQFAIPLGGGVQWAISNNVRIGYEIGIRNTFTDYLDDVSKTYVDPVVLAMKKGQNAVRYAYRGNELPNGDPYPAEGTKRGSVGKNDSYMFSGVTLRVRIAPKGKKQNFTYKKGKAKTSCPKPF